MIRFGSKRIPGMGVLILALAMAGVAAAPAPASAGILDTIISIIRTKRPGTPSVRPPISRAPEIDPGAARAAAAVLLGGVLALADRRRRS